MTRVADINSYPTPPTELERLVGIVQAIQGSILHDVMTPLTALASLIDFAIDLLQRKPGTDAQVLDCLQRAVTGSQRIAGILSPMLHPDRSLSRWLVSQPYSIAQTMIRLYPGTNFTISRRASRTLRILYPRAALLPIIGELVQNAVKHTPGTAVHLDWRLARGRFTCSVHDAGTGIVPDLPKRYTQLDILPISLRHQNGLPLINYVVSRSGGLTLVRRSRSLGGTEVSFMLPVLAHSFQRLPKADE